MTLTPSDDRRWIQRLAKSWLLDWLKRTIKEEDSMRVLTKNEGKLVAELLRAASEQFSNYGCNDFDLRSYGLESMAEELNRAVHVHDEEMAAQANPVMEDWLLMSHFADKLDPPNEH